MSRFFPRTRLRSAIIVFALLLPLAVAPVHAQTQVSVYLPVITNRTWTNGDPPGVTILSNHSSYIGFAGLLTIVGEVRNNSADSLTFIKPTVEILSGSGTVIATDSEYAPLDTLAPGDKTCFSVRIAVRELWHAYRFKPVSFEPRGHPVPALNLRNLEGSHSGFDDKYLIDGEVQNPLAIPVEFVAPVGTLYGNGDKVIGCATSILDGFHLAPGESKPFRLSFDNAGTGMTFRVQVEGRPQ